MQLAKQQTALEYIKELQLLAPPVAIAQSGDDDFDVPEISVGENSAAISAGSIVAFDQRLDARSKRIVLDSILFAQLAANAKYKREFEPRQWYQAFADTLGVLGWVISSTSLNEKKLVKSKVDLTEIALEVIGAVASGGSLPILETALKALKASANEGAVTLFESNSYFDTMANYQIGEARQDIDGNLSMPIGLFHFTTSTRKKNFLFIKWNNKRVSLLVDAKNLVFNSARYESVQSILQQRIEEIRLSYIASVDLAAVFEQ